VLITFWHNWQPTAIKSGIWPSKSGTYSHRYYYKVVLNAIRTLENDEHHECLESSVLKLVRAIFGFPAVAVAAVSMLKPHVYSGHAVPTVALTLTRANWDRMNQ
jgi:dihydroneopterin aldolase